MQRLSDCPGTRSGGGAGAVSLDAALPAALLRSRPSCSRSRNGSEHHKLLELLLTGQQYFVRSKSRSALKNDVVEMPLTDLLFLRTSSIKICPLWSLRDFVYFLIDSAINANWAVRIDWICIETYDH